MYIQWVLPRNKIICGKKIKVNCRGTTISDSNGPIVHKIFVFVSLFSIHEFHYLQFIIPNCSVNVYMLTSRFILTNSKQFHLPVVWNNIFASAATLCMSLKDNFLLFFRLICNFYFSFIKLERNIYRKKGESHGN